MEHRWGQRIAFDRLVRLTGRPLALGVGRLRDLSLSGAWIRTSLVLAPGARVELSIEADGPGSNTATRVEASVVRCDGLGMGIEWCVLAPEAVLRWLRGAAAELMSATTALAEATAGGLPYRSLGS
jgi:hypothetical protein